MSSIVRSNEPDRPTIGARSWAPLATAPHAVLVHGVSSSSASWWQVGPELAARGWAVAAIDLPGHGTNRLGDVEFAPAALARFVARRLPDEIDLLVGHSLGALVALEIAASAPERVGTIVLEEPAGRVSVDWPTVAAELKRNAQEARAAPSAKLEEIRNGFPGWHELDCRHALDDLIAFDDESVLPHLANGSRWHTIALATSIDVPTLVLLAPDRKGRYDEREDGTALRGVERRALLVTRARAGHRLFDAGHCIHRDDPQGWIESVTDFAARRNAATEQAWARRRDG